MSGCPQQPSALQSQHGLYIKAGWFKQRLAERALGSEWSGIGPGQPDARDNLAHQREAIGMHAARREAQDGIAGRDVAGQQRSALRCADREAGEIIVPSGIQARHLCRLSANQSAAGCQARLGDAGDDRSASLDRELADRQVIEKEQRLGALHDQVVDAHRDQISADRAVIPGLDGDQQLGADAVGAGDQHGIGKAGGG